MLLFMDNASIFDGARRRRHNRRPSRGKNAIPKKQRRWNFAQPATDTIVSLAVPMISDDGDDNDGGGGHYSPRVNHIIIHYIVSLLVARRVEEQDAQLWDFRTFLPRRPAR